MGMATTVSMSPRIIPAGRMDVVEPSHVELAAIHLQRTLYARRALLARIADMHGLAEGLRGDIAKLQAEVAELERQAQGEAVKVGQLADAAVSMFGGEK